MWFRIRPLANCRPVQSFFAPPKPSPASGKTFVVPAPSAPFLSFAPGGFRPRTDPAIGCSGGFLASRTSRGRHFDAGAVDGGQRNGSGAGNQGSPPGAFQRG